MPPKHLQLLLRTNQQSKKTKINPNQTPLPSSVPVLSTQSENISVIEKLNPNQTLILNEDDSVTLICLSEGGNCIASHRFDSIWFCSHSRTFPRKFLGLDFLLQIKLIPCLFFFFCFLGFGFGLFSSLSSLFTLF